MTEQPAEDASNHSIPWVAIAAVVLIFGVVVTAGLGSVEAPGPASAPATVQHVRADLGHWQPFADAGRSHDAGADALTPDVSEAD